MQLLLIMSALSGNAHAANCPVDAFAGQYAESVLFYDDVLDKFTFVDADGDWLKTPTTVGDPTTASWSLDFNGVATGTAGNYEWGIGITDTGALGAFGYTVTSGLPSGAAPYSSPASGSTGRFAVLDSSGTVVDWGNSANSWLTAEPATTGFTAIDVGRNVGCAVSEVNNTGVTCWGGSDPRGLIGAADRPTTGYMKDVAVGDTVVLYVDINGNTGGWCTPTAGAVRTSCLAFLANMPASGVESVEVNETGEFVGSAWNEDGTATFWQDPSKGLQPLLRNAPGFTDYGNNTDRIYTPEGPSGYITFVTAPHVGIYQISAIGAGVIDDPQGLVDLRVGTYDYGDAIMWDNTSIMSGGLYYYQPKLIDACDP